MKILAFLIFTTIFWLPVHAAEMGDDGLHKTAWMRDTFKDLGEDLAEANDEGKRLLLLVEQRGCSYCRKMHETVYIVPEIKELIEQEYFVVQINMFGDIDVTDFDGTVLSEKDMVRRWGLLFTPTMVFLPEVVADDNTAREAAVVVMPGAFEKGTTLSLLQWVLEEGYSGDEPFQKYHARRLEEQ
jgi:thioredoxin-related protein